MVVVIIFNLLHGVKSECPEWMSATVKELPLNMPASSEAHIREHRDTGCYSKTLDAD